MTHGPKVAVITQTELAVRLVSALVQIQPPPGVSVDHALACMPEDLRGIALDLSRVALDYFAEVYRQQGLDVELVAEADIRTATRQ